jgi:hypothetical protein
MSEIKQQRISSEHSADDIWQAINTPLMSPEIGRLVNPYVEISYKDLPSIHSLLREGVRIIYEPNLDELEPVLGMTAAMLPKDIELRVADHDPDNKVRIDVLESEKHSGTIQHRVEEVDGAGILVIEGELSLGGSKKMFEGTIASYAEQGLVAHNQRILDNLSVILAR